MIHLYNIPIFVRNLIPGLVWQIDTKDKEIFLTFDDGPVPDLTPYVLDVLEEYQAKATFFCVGENIHKHPEIFKRVVAAGHAIGNHTYNHLKSWSSNRKHYLHNIQLCTQTIEEHTESFYPLFRPPHGQISRSIIKNMKGKYKIIMWDLLAYDFSNNHSPEKSLRKIVAGTRPGSIVVFHDNYKAEEKLKYMLPRFLSHFSEKGYKFSQISPPNLNVKS